MYREITANRLEIKKDINLSYPLKQNVMKTLKTGLLICGTIILVFLFSACKKDESAKTNKSAINIKMWETLGNAQRIMKLHCSTEKHYPCSNFIINYTLTTNNEMILIDFIGTVEPKECLTAIGPASTTINLGTISNGTYNFEISVDKRKSKGALIVTSDYFKIDLDRQKNVSLPYTVLNRIPNGTIWGTIGYNTASSATIAQSFVDDLESLGASAQPYNAGEYGHFKIDENGQILPPENHGNYFNRPFIYHYTGNTQGLENIVKDYGQNHGDLLNITLFTTNGEEFRSWMQ
jgi:hypothetical protein